jgi:hypothetical protein
VDSEQWTVGRGKRGEFEIHEEQQQILRLTTPELKNVRGPFRSG